MILISDEISIVKENIRNSLFIIRQYDWLLNSYVLDFFTENHWEKMPQSWIKTFDCIQPEILSELLEPNEKKPSYLWPLSLLALRSSLKRLSINRIPHDIDKNDVNNNSKLKCKQNQKLQTLLCKKNIKDKKRHEIELMGRLTAQTAEKSNVDYIVDFGAGVAHMARSLCFNYSLNVCCLEQNTALIKQAEILDTKFGEMVEKLNGNASLFHAPKYVNIRLERDTDLNQLVRMIKQTFGLNENEQFSFGIIGLHPCGDLASILIDFFIKCKEAKFINVIGCCYMKLTCQEQNILYERTAKECDFLGYPLSDYLLKINAISSHLDYEAREIACHAIEKYTERLSSGNYDYLKVHSFRAEIERIIQKYWPEKKHSGLKSIKTLTTFTDYCKQAVTHLQIEIPEHDINSNETIRNLTNWKNVVIFYTLRLMLAPLVESVILYDRFLHILENGCDASIRAIFSPIISSRNQIITAIKPILE